MKKQLSISGMTCASCVAHVEGALLRVPGVNQAVVNLATESAEVSVVDDNVPGNIEAELVRAVVAAGYGAQLAKEDIFDQENERFALELAAERGELMGSILLSTPLVLSMLVSLFNINWMLPNWIAFLVATPVQFYYGRRFLKGAWRQLSHGSANMDVLVSLGTLAAFCLSTYQWLVLGGHETYFEASAVVITLVSLGKYLEHRARRQASEAIRSLQSLRPEMSRLIDPGRPVRFNRLIPTQYLMPGDRILVPAGERIGSDGLVDEGQSEVDESLITGESNPVLKRQGDQVIAGTLNGLGRLVITVTTPIGESVLAKIISRVIDAQANKPPIQRLVDRVSQVFVPVVLVIALITFILNFWYSKTWDLSLIRAVSVLVIACPCALGLATPVSIMVGTGLAAQKGILIRDASALEETHRIERVVFDKTGTLTEGAPQLVDVTVVPSLSKARALAISAGLQTGVTHPLSQAVLHYADKEGVVALPCKESIVLAGSGIEGVIVDKDGLTERYRLISLYRFKEWGGSLPEELNDGSYSEHTHAIYTQSVLALVTNDNQLTALALFLFTDPIRPEARDAILQLLSQSLSISMLSGDHHQSAWHVAKQLGITDVKAELTPELKLNALKEWQQHQHIVAMVGDGINDAPALAQANVGIAMGSGTDVANSAASVTLLRPDLRLVAEAIRLSRVTWRTIQQNLFWAFFYNVIGIPLAAMGYLSPVLAGFAMAFSSVTVVTNALLLRRK
ncbi:heavy metal translocating P-type ATPase [Ferrovum sp. PN-J185]|uniref:heavy metal translocating P-type ATPase n=1 Tax=Ferrovum sp. PN-J185 TaxID=1356306 RepID=UPI00079B0A37|nr:heavy metal translocating P-type ATPase [Ferrovum sp. PN-J185]KXW55232.1 putative copper-importing P-type ATPase A [Ferrovum sp. PN-J185]MCC6068047.1 heavy metal translocating P-type ATPase [Ferrovum sp. PN-J185]